MTDFDLLVARDIDALRSRHEATLVDYVRKVYDFPELTGRIMKTFWTRLRTVEFDDRSTTNHITGVRSIDSVLQREIDQAGVDNVRRAGYWPEYLRRGEAAWREGRALGIR